MDTTPPLCAILIPHKIKQKSEGGGLDAKSISDMTDEEFDDIMSVVEDFAKERTMQTRVRQLEDLDD